jgi:hypothetical protein
MQFRLRRVFGGVGLLVTISACADRITAPPQTSEVQVPPRRNAAVLPELGTAAAHGRAGSPYFCSVSSLVQDKTDRYEYGTVLLRVTPAELAADGLVAIYNVISFGGGGEVVGRARCQIPDTDAARRHVDRLFHVRPVPASINRVGERNGTVTQSDGTGIEGVTGYACLYGGTFPYCNYGPPMVPTWQQTQVQCPAMDPSCGSGGSDTGEWYWDGGTGDTSEPPPPDDPRDPCRRDSQGYCVPEIPTTLEWQKLLDAIDGIQENNEACAGAKRYLQRLASNGRGANLKMWTGTDIVGGTQYFGANRFFPSGERYIQWDRYWGLRELPLVVHEGLHAYFSLLANNSGLEGSSETYAIQYQETCGYTYSDAWKASGR